MRTRFMTTLMLVASLLVSVQALAQPQLPTFQSGDVLRANDLNLIVERLKAHTNALSGSDGETRMVDCGAGETIKATMAQAQPGDTIMITGTCNENVVVSQDSITLAGEGQDSTVIDGSNDDAAAILVKGHRNVTIKDLTVQNGLSGIKIVESGAAWLEDVTVQGSRGKEGHDGGDGILVSASASAVLTGAIVANNNAGQGIFVLNSSSVFIASNVVVEGVTLPQASLQANNNGDFGIHVLTSSAIHILVAIAFPRLFKRITIARGLGYGMVPRRSLAEERALRQMTMAASV